jgi:transaldolase
VASLVVSPWDVAGNAVLGPALNNRLGTAVAMRTFKLYRDLLVGQRWRRLGLAGAPVQRLLWTATDSPDPYLGDTYYVEALAAPNTINAMPEATLLAFADRGSATMTFTVAAARADATLAEVAAAGVDVDAMGIELQLSGIVSALDAWQESIRCIEARSGTVENARQGSLASPRL